MYTMRDFIKKEQEKAIENMERGAEIRRDFEATGGPSACDYYTHHTRMWEYYRGEYNALTKVLRNFDGESL